jgi:hypothetical protein
MPTATRDTGRRPDSSLLHLRAFGLDLETTFPMPGATGSAPDEHPERPIRLELASRDGILADWKPVAPERISTRRGSNGRIAVSIDADECAGYLIRAQGFGCFWISPDARRVRCAPLQVTAWRWQRYLIGQVLPLAAVLRGLEVFHASAVVMGGQAMAFLGASTAGKTSIAVHLVARGAVFMTDDVLVLSRGPGGGVLAHAGTGVANVRHTVAAMLDSDGSARLGRALGRDREARRVELSRHDDPAPLAYAVILDRRDRGAGLELQRVRPVDPRLLLGGSFNFIIRTPDRLTNQLDVCARIANTVAVYRAVVPPSAGPAEVAHAIEREVA